MQIPISEYSGSRGFYDCRQSFIYLVNGRFFLPKIRKFFSCKAMQCTLCLYQKLIDHLYQSYPNPENRIDIQLSLKRPKPESIQLSLKRPKTVNPVSVNFFFSFILSKNRHIPISIEKQSNPV